MKHSASGVVNQRQRGWRGATTFQIDIGKCYGGCRKWLLVGTSNGRTTFLMRLPPFAFVSFSANCSELLEIIRLKINHVVYVNLSQARITQIL